MVVANIYYIFEFILLSVIDIAEISLLLTIYTLIYQCFLYPNGANASKAGMKKKIFTLHVGVCGLLGLLYVVYFALGIKYTVDTFQAVGSNLLRYRRSTPSFIKVDVAYQAFLFVATVEILAASIYLLVTKTKRGLSSMVKTLLLNP